MPGRDTTPAAQTRAPATTTSKAPIAGFAALVVAAVVAISPVTRLAEGDALVSYQDQGKVWTAGNGHTGPDVHPGMRITDAQRATWLRADLIAHTSAALTATPALAAMPSALQAAGDFAFNAGDARWATSPMAAHFARHEWRAGCEAFRGYIVLYRAPVLPNGKAKPGAGQTCRRNAKGVLYCEAKGLVRRRETERAICLAGLPA